MLFDKLADATFELLEKIEAAPRKPDPTALQGDSPESVQKTFIMEIIAHLGYDLGAGRMDRSAHPFTSKNRTGRRSHHYQVRSELVCHGPFQFDS